MSSSTLSIRLAAPLRVIGFAIVLLVLFAVTAFVSAWLFAVVSGADLFSIASFSGGIILSLIVWLFVLVFHVKKETVVVPYTNKAQMVDQVRKGLQELGYEVNESTKNRIVGQPSFAAFLFGGTIQGRFEDNTLTLSGPKISVEKLRSSLRFDSHLTNNRKSLGESGWSVGNGLVKGVQITFQIPETNAAGLTEEIKEALTNEGASVYGNVNMWALNEQGLSEEKVSKLVLEKTRHLGIAVTIQKKPLASRESAMVKV